ncbi:MAG: KH domain-containing protein [Spirulina sp. SIO3F2]|nr:KH domain-containing protein [Spirulina sp. SIO3F2]
MPNETNPSESQSAGVQPDYGALVRYLVSPLLENPESLSVSCEWSRGQQRALVRVAFGDNDQGRVLGRGGRNLDAMRVVLAAAAQTANQTVRLEVFDLRRTEGESRRRGASDRPRNQRSRPTRPPVPRKR